MNLAVVIVLAVALVAAALMLQGLIVMVLWNLVAPIFWASAPQITFFQGFLVGLALSTLGSFFRSPVQTK